MLFYPQLSTGAIAQYPLRRSAVTRCVMNLLPDGSAIKLADPDARTNRWELRYTGLSDEERTTLEKFFRAAEGALNDFTFLDPEGNLLRWSEDATKPVWKRDGLIGVTAANEFGVSQMRNNGQVGQGIEQIVSGPGWYQYCFSAEARSDTPAAIVMSLANADGQLVAEPSCGAAWRRVWCAGSIAGLTNDIRCRVEIPAGAMVEFRCMQLVAQPMPGSYKRTASSPGVYSARFAQDQIQFRADGVNDHATVVRLAGRPGE